MRPLSPAPPREPCTAPRRAGEEALRALRSGKTEVLLATDLAGRGIDLRRASVVHFDLPPTLRQYVHRCGRTGRSGTAGTSVCLLQANREGRQFARLVRPLLSRAGLAVPPAIAGLLAAEAPGGEEQEGQLAAAPPRRSASPQASPPGSPLAALLDGSGPSSLLDFARAHVAS